MIQKNTDLSHHPLPAADTQLSRLAAASGFLVAGLGLTVMIGWISGQARLVQVFVGSVPMQFNTALCFLLCGLGLLLVVFGRNKLVAGSLAATAGLIAAFTIVEYITGISLGIDELFVRHFIQTKTSNPGRMAPNTAICFILAAGGLLALNRPQPRGLWAMAFTGSLLLGGLAAVSLLGYFLGIEAAYGWGTMTRMAVHTAVGFTVLAAGLTVCLWTGQPHGDSRWRWLPTMIATTLAVVTLVIWEALQTHNAASLHQIVQQEVERTQEAITVRMNERLDAIARMAQCGRLTTLDERLWKHDASLYLKHFSSTQSIFWVDDSFQVRCIVSGTSGEHPVAQDLVADDDYRRTLEWAGRHDAVAVSASVNLPSGGKGLLVVAPIGDRAERYGFILAVFRRQDLFDELFVSELTPNCEVEVFDGDHWLYATGDISSFDARFKHETELTVSNASLRLCIWPQPAFIHNAASTLPAAVLVFGLLSAAGLGLSIHFMVVAHERLGVIGRANANLRRYAIDLEDQVSRRQQAEQAVRATEERLRRAMLHAPFPVFIHAEGGAILHVSDAVQKLTGYRPEEMATLDDWTRLAHGEKQSEVKKSIEALYAIERPVNSGELLVETRFGAARVWDFRSAPLGQLPDGRRLIVSMASDVTERKEAETGLKRRETLLHSILNAIDEGVTVADTEGRFLICNPSAERLSKIGPTDTTPDQWTQKYGVYLPDKITPCPTEQLPLVRAMRGESVRDVELFLRHSQIPNGIFISCSAAPVLDEQRRPIAGVVVFRDISESKQARDALVHVQERLELAVRGSSDGLWDWDIPTGKVWYAPQFKNLLGYGDDEFPNEFQSFKSHLHPEDRDPTMAAIEGHLTKGAPIDIECRLRTRGRGYRWFRARGEVTRDGQGRPVRMAGSIQDITDRKEVQQQLEAKNRDLETLLYVTSHDLREPLRAVESFSQMVVDRYSDKLDDKGRDLLGRVVRGAHRMDHLIDDVLTLSRAQRADEPSIRVEGSAVVSEALQSLESRIRETGAQLEVKEDIPPLWVQRRWAVQAVFNLIGNALKFTRNGEPPQVEVAGYSPHGPEAADVGIVVRDRGPGVAPAHAERIFSLFQRAVGREVEGTGAGLAIVRQVAQRHGGWAWCEPREGGGSEFFITFGGGSYEKRNPRYAPDREYLVGR